MEMVLIQSDDLRAMILDAVNAGLKDYEQRTAPKKFEDEFIDINKAAEMLDIHPATLRRLTLDKTIPCHKTGRHILFKKSEILKTEEQHYEKYGRRRKSQIL